ncbi:MAG: VTT domain-containing protein [Chloroflexota bacterium]|nr:VTT domain-containing protein [Chloroflexota bacterium]
MLGLAGLGLVSAAMFVVTHAVGIERIRSAVEAAGPWGPVVYIAMKVATFVIAPLSGAPLRISSGAVFGYWEGVLLTILGNVLGGSLNFWISRLIGRRVVVRCIGMAAMANVDRLVGRLGDWRALAFARIFLAPLWDIVSYAAGFTRIRYATYLVVAIVGDIIPTMLFVGIGASLVEDPRLLLVILVGFALLYGLAPVVRRLAPGTWRERESQRTEA